MAARGVGAEAAGTGEEDGLGGSSCGVEPRRVGGIIVIETNEPVNRHTESTGQALEDISMRVFILSTFEAGDKGLLYPCG
jgi:hypothetical protein